MGRFHRHNKGKIKRNVSALLSFVLVILSGFLFSLFSLEIFGQSLPDKKGVMFNLIIDLFSGKYNLTKGYEIVVLIMIIIYILIALFYLLNGLGIIYNRYSRYASILSIIFLFLGLIATLLMNREQSISLFGITFNSMTIGLGTFFITIIGIAYLFLHKWINSTIRL